MIFLNQSCGDLFCDVIDKLRGLVGPHFLIAGNGYKQWADVQFIKCCGLQKDNSSKRLMTWTLFFLQTFYHLARQSRNQHVLFVSNPPIAMWMGPFFQGFCKSRYSLLIYDIYPDVLVSAGILSRVGILASLWRKLNAKTLRGANNVITLGDGMARSLREQMPRGQRRAVSVIENWVDTDFFTPMPKEENPLLQELKLEDKFIVAYAGSFGACHGVERIVQCANLLREQSHIHFLLVGGGTEEDKIKQHLQSRALQNVTLLPFQPREKFRYVAAAPDVSLILLRPGMGKAVMPSKVYTALSAGTAVLAVAEADSDLGRLVERNRCGIVVDADDPEVMADRLVLLTKDPRRVSEMKDNARRAAVTFYDKKRQCGKLFELFYDDVERRC